MAFAPFNFGRYVSQTEYSMGESEQTQAEQKPAINNIPPLMSLSITLPAPIITTNTQQKTTLPPSVIKENIEPLPFPQHAPGPIQRPNKLSCSSTTQLSSFLQDSSQSPSTPDVLTQINHLVDQQNSITTIPSNINDIPTPNVPWTPFLTYDSTWPITNIQSPNISLTTQIQNPFAQRQISKEESSLWSSNFETPTSWLKFSSIPDSSSSNRQDNDANNHPLWNSINLNETQQNSSTSWWPKPSSSDENNNHDQSRWDFAR